MEGSTGAGRRLPPASGGPRGHGWPLLSAVPATRPFAGRDLRADVAYGMTSEAGDPTRGAIGGDSAAPPARPSSSRAYASGSVSHSAAVSLSVRDRGRFHLQTMVFGPNMIPVDRIDIRAPRDSDAWHLALMGRQFPGSFLPFSQEQIIRSAEPHLRLVSSASGRLDYIETIRQWRKRFAAPSLKKTLLKLQLLPRWLTSADFRLAFTSGVSANSVCFERELLDHYRLVFEKTR
jgi:hypothetical protein